MPHPRSDDTPPEHSSAASESVDGVPSADAVDVELRVHRRYDQFSDQDQQRLLAVVQALLGLEEPPASDRHGGVIVTIRRLSRNQADLLLKSANAGHFEEFSVLAARVLEPDSLPPPASEEPLVRPGGSPTNNFETKPYVKLDESEATSMSLLERVKAEDPYAWTRFVELYGRLIYRWCQRRGLGEHDAADVSQLVFVTLHQKLDTFSRNRPGDSFRGWLYTITSNKIRDFFRQQNKQDRGGAGEQPLESLVVADDPSSVREVSEERALLAHRMLELVRGEFLDVHFQAFCRRIDGQDTADVAADLNINKMAVYNAVARIKRRLREEFGDVVDSDILK